MGFCERAPMITGSGSGTQWVTLNSVIPKQIPKSAETEGCGYSHSSSCPSPRCLYSYSADPGVWAREPILEGQRAVARHRTGAQPLFSPPRLPTILLKVAGFCVMCTRGWCRWQPSPLVPFGFGLRARHGDCTVPHPAISPQPLCLPLRLLCTLRPAGWLPSKGKHPSLF